MSRILIVDDSAMVRKFHSYILSSFGYEVSEAEDGYLALEKLLAENFDLIITDINMPRMDGFQFITELRGLAAYEETPIIIVTTQEHISDVDRGYILGANVYCVKPTEIEQIVHWVRHHLKDDQGKEV